MWKNLGFTVTDVFVKCWTPSFFGPQFFVQSKGQLFMPWAKIIKCSTSPSCIKCTASLSCILHPLRLTTMYPQQWTVSFLRLWDDLVCVLCQYHQPWWPPRQFYASTCSMAASSVFKRSLGCAPLGDVPHIVPPHLHGDQDCQWFTCIFRHRHFQSFPQP
jgi:hypothetical protein